MGPNKPLQGTRRKRHAPEWQRSAARVTPVRLRHFDVMTTLTIASSDRHLEEILALQQRYLARAVSHQQQAREGFVFAEHTLPLLRRMAAEAPQAIAVSDVPGGWLLPVAAALSAGGVAESAPDV